MNGSTHVNLHCHTVFSDGTLSPEQVAERLAMAGVAFASLTDHDTVDGLARFRQALARRGVGFITGLEMTTRFGDAEAHLLAYGFDPRHAELLATLASVRQARVVGVDGITQSMRQLGADGGAPGHGAAPNGWISTQDAIALVHRAGGVTVLAHPLYLEADRDRLRAALVKMKNHGLDGLEAIYAKFDAPQRTMLCELADELGLLVSAGTDFHEPGDAAMGIDMPADRWKRFRDAIRLTAGTAEGSAAGGPRHESHRLKRRHFVFHIIFPVLLVIALFVVAIFAILLPRFEGALLDRKREMIRELTNTASSILAEAEGEERAGRLSRADAQRLASSRIQRMRYGREGKDYFWLQDMTPRIVMHPYRADLVGKDVSDFQDPRGARIFVEFAELVRRQKEGYIDYVWQWKDDPHRLVPKESYVQGFEPWGWIIGTGIYIEDVKEEIGRIERNIVRAAIGISAVVAMLLFYVMRESLRLERERRDAEDHLKESTDRYRSLVEAATEGTLLVLEGRCRYANPILLEMLGYSEQEVEFLDPGDLIPEDEDNDAAWTSIKRLEKGEEVTGGFEGAMRRQDGSRVDCVMTLSRISFGGRDGFILLAREARSHFSGGIEDNPERWHRLAKVADGTPVAMFRARAVRWGAIVDANREAVELFGPAREGSTELTRSLADLFGSEDEYAEFVKTLDSQGNAERRLQIVGKGDRSQVVLLRAVLRREESGAAIFIDGVIEDITASAAREAERETVIQRLQTSLLFLHQPVQQLSRPVVSCRVDASISSAASLMAAKGSTFILVLSESGEAIGIVTDRDLRDRVLAAGLAAQEPVHRAMSSPLVTISEHAQIYEAMLKMQERNVQHVAIADETGRVVGVIRGKELLQSPGYGAIVLTREIGRATTVEEVVLCCKRVSSLAKTLLDCGAHPRNITRMVASVCDAATERFVSLAIAQLGPAPAAFAFVALGSQGRQEQSLFTDQDNAIIYAATSTLPLPLGEGRGEGDVATNSGDTSDKAAAYFLELGSRVCGWLAEAGYSFCRGEIMAKTPKWVQPLPAWKQYFDGWISRAEPQELLEFCIFFDLRSVYGAGELVRELREHVRATLKDCPAFFPHFAQNALQFKPPMRLFGKIIGTAAAGEAPGVNLKDAMMPIVNFARLYALKHEVNETHTLDRLDKLVEVNVLLPASRDEMAAAYDFLMRLRLRHQSAAIQSGESPDNTINHRKLGHLEEAMLKQSFTQIDAVQKRISSDFLGGM